MRPTGLIAAFGFALAPAQVPAEAQRPNVVILLADDLGSKDLGCYGGPVKTPVLDSLAARGVRFTDFHAGAAVCSPSRATLLTGRQNLRTGIYGVLQDQWHNMHLLEREVTIAEVLQEAGYGTAHFGKWHIGMTSGKRKKPSLQDHGFDYWFGLSNGAHPNHRNPTNFLRNGKRVGPMKGYSCQIVVSDAINWLETKANPDQPFFMNIWFNEPHATLAAPDEITSIYGDLKDEAAIYSATVDNTDRAIGRLVAKLKETGQLDNTLIIYSSDHGSYRADRNGGLNGNKGSNFQGGLRSPGIFFWPEGIRGDRMESTPSGSVDLLPTICGLAGIDRPKGVHLDGSDLSPLLVEKGTFTRSQPMFWLSPSSGHLATLREGNYTLMGYRGYKLPANQVRKNELLREMAKLAGIDPSTPNLGSRVTNTTFTSPEYKRLKSEFVRLRTFQEAWIPTIKAGGFSRLALYDLKADPLQKKDISKQRPEVTNRLKKKLLTLYKDVMADAPDWLPVEEEKKAANSPGESVETLVEASCIECHDSATKTGLNFEDLAFDLANADTFGVWEKVFDMIESGKMPPEKKPRPDPGRKTAALSSLGWNLRRASLAQQERGGRTPARRLTRAEYEYTLHDLLGIGGDLASKLPPENTSSTFDTIAADQGISPVHIRSYLAAADAAIDEAIELGRRPRMEPRLIDYRNNSYVQTWFKRELRRGGNTVLRADDAFVLFDNRPQRSPHTNQSNNMGIRFPVAGRYRIVAEAYAYQAKTPVTFCLYRANDRAAKRELIGSWQLDPGKPRQVEIEHYFRPGDFFFLAPSDLDATPQGKNVFMVGARNYPGEGVAIRRLTLEGPLEKQWPPERTRDLLGDVEFRAGQNGKHTIVLRERPMARIKDVVSRIGPRVLRRPLRDGETEKLAVLAVSVLKEGRGFEEALRVVLRAMFSSPEFLYHQAEPGRLDDYALATRLSCFLWKSLPDDQLCLLAAEGKLSESAVLASEVDRMLDDEKSQRFVEDFLDQWLELEDIDATTPDEKLYPEYDDVLRQAMLEETRRFFSELIWDDRGVREFIDSEFTFLNRRLAEHYGIPGIEGLEFRKVNLPAESPRGGLLTQASLLKVTANGTNTSPVPRGSFVLANLLGTPPSPPPPGAGAVEPDTRGTTTIREELAAHRRVDSCNRCHREIDPPGFALESFNPIGGFRTRYRSSGKGDRPSTKLFGRPVREYRLGPRVDASGTTARGERFAGIRDFKRLLMKNEDQVARHFLNQLIAYSTGAEIQFADRNERDRILEKARGNGYGLRGMIHAVVQSEMFRNK
jgi:arylsulfatase A-like enzyme